MAKLDRAALLALAARRPAEEVAVRGYGTVLVRGLSADEWDEYERASTKEEDGKVKFEPDRRVLVRAALVGEDGAPLFTADDEAALGSLPAAVVNAVCSAAMRLSGAGKAQADATGKG